MNKERKKRGHLIPFRQNAEYFFQRALVYYHQNKLNKAKKLLLHAVKIDDREPVYICQLAAVLAELGDFAASNKWLHYVLNEVDPSLTECYFFLASNYAHLGEFEKAEEEALYYLEVDPEGDFAEDAEDLLYFIGSEIPKDYQENAIIRQHTEAKKKMEEGQFGEAIRLFSDMIREHPHFWAAYNNLALAYFYANKKQKALSTLDLVLTKNPGNLHALCNLALFYRFLGFKEQSKNIVERLKKVYPILEEHRYKLGSTFSLLHEHEFAYMWLSSLDRTRLPEDLPYYHWLAVSAFLTGRIRVAKSAWQHVERIDPDGEVAPYYLKKLGEGTLTRDEVDYHYRVPANSQSYYELLTKGLKEDERAKMFHLYILRKNFSEKGYQALRKFCQESSEALHLKELAACVMLKQAPHLPVMIKHEGLEMIYTDEAQLPKSVSTGIRVIERLQRSVKSGLLNDIIYRFWPTIFKYAYAHALAFANEKGWAAALEYLASDEEQRPSQKAIAKKYRISPATVSYYVKRIKRIVEEQP